MFWHPCLRGSHIKPAHKMHHQPAPHSLNIQGKAGETGIEFNSRIGENTYGLRFSRINELDDDSAGNGTRTLIVPGQPIVIDASHHRGAEKAGYGFNASLSRPLLEGAFSANLTLQQTTFNSSVFFDAPSAARFPDNHKVRSAEAGANWDRTFGAVELTLVGLQRLERNEYFNASISSGSTQVFNSVSDTSESILRGTLRSYKPEVRQLLRAGVERTAKAVADMAGASAPEVRWGAGAASVISDAALTEKTAAVFKAMLGNKAQLQPQPAAASEDFSELIAAGVPCVFYGIGSLDPAAVAAARACSVAHR